MKRILYIILLLLVTTTSFAQNYPRKCTEEDIPSSERKAYFEQVERFLRNYYDLLLGIKNSESKNDFINHHFKSKEESNYLPEFMIPGQQNNFITPTQYLLEFEKKLEDYDWDNLEFEINDFNHNKDIILQNAISSYIISEYILTLKDSENIIFKSKCEAFCYFPKTMSHVTVKMMQVKAIEDIISYKHPVQIITQSLYEEAIVLYKNHKYEEAVALFEEAAEQGHAGAQYHLGKLYEKGEGVPQSYKKAFDWIFNAARNGYADAQYEIGQYHESVYWGSGRGSVFWNKVESIDDKPHHWVVKKREDSYFLAKEYYRLAMEKGHSLAALELGFLYYLKEDSKEQYKECILKAFTDSNIKRLSEATNELKMRASQIPYRKNKWIWEYVFMFAKKGTIYGDVNCQGILGHCFLYAKGCKKNYNEAFRLLKLAAEQGDSDAQYDLGECYYKGWGTEVNSKLGEYWNNKYWCRE